MKERWDNKIAAATEVCARAEDLVAYLYGEAPPGEARDFERHMEQCASCRAELKSFGNVRTAITEWRQQALGTTFSPAFEAQALTSAEQKRAEAPRRRSAFAALREFFALSPMWMRAATAIVALVFCALAAIAVLHFAQQPKTVVVERVVQTGISEQEANDRVAAAIKKLNESKASETPASSSQENNVAQNKSNQNAQPARNNPQLAINKVTRPITPRRLTEPATELVRADDYLPFTASKDEEKLPSLSDLVSEDN